MNELTVAGEAKTTPNGMAVRMAVWGRGRNILAMKSYLFVFKIKTFHIEGLKDVVTSAKVCLY